MSICEGMISRFTNNKIWLNFFKTAIGCPYAAHALRLTCALHFTDFTGCVIF